MANFNDALLFTLKHEGTTLLEDKISRERSRYGITQLLLRAINYGITDPNNLMQSDVQNIYNKVFWQPNNLTSINSQLIANKIFDMMVNMGQFQATKLLQASLNSIGRHCVIDGKLGPHTMIELNASIDTQLLEELRIKCVGFYTAIAKDNNAKYLAGWLTRSNDVGYGEVDYKAYNTLRSGDDDKIVRG